MRRLSYKIIRTARDGINTIDAERRRQGLSQMAISEKDVGQQYYRMYKSGTCSLPVFIRFCQSLGYKVAIIKTEAQDGEKETGA